MPAAQQERRLAAKLADAGASAGYSHWPMRAVRQVYLQKIELADIIREQKVEIYGFPLARE
jgi:hypothetical protein